MGRGLLHVGLLDLLLTYSNHPLPDVQRNGLLHCIGQLIDVNHGGRIVKRY